MEGILRVPQGLHAVLHRGQGGVWGRFVGGGGGAGLGGIGVWGTWLGLSGVGVE